ncbi:glycosyltransferase family 32 protein [Sphingomonas aerolata]|uniref:glycosyltransferase family 32 protein n=1 Tax=Sphingomonas aerolata TaxID=185951 RepID=UPI002FE0B380
MIFQTWKSRSVIPGNYRHWRQTFVDTNPDCRVLLWDDADNRAFIADRFAWALPVYDSYPQEIFRADAVRFFFLLEFGGLYADMDTECLRPIRPSASTGAVVLCRMGGNPDFAHAIPNAIMASRPSQIFWLFAIHCMIEAAEHIPDAAARIAAGPETMTGPVLLKQAYDAFVALDEAAVMALLAPSSPSLPSGSAPGCAMHGRRCSTGGTGIRSTGPICSTSGCATGCAPTAASCRSRSAVLSFRRPRLSPIGVIPGNCGLL